MATDKLSIDAPEITPPTGGLLDVATVRSDVENIAFFRGVEYHERYDSGLLLFGENDEATNGKTFSDRTTNTLVEAAPITAYIGVEALLFDKDNAKEQLEEAFRRNESTSLEKVFQRDVLNAGTDLTPTAGTAVTDPRLAAGILEQWFGEQFGGRPVLHTSRLGANLLQDILEHSAGYKMHTAQGSPLAYGSGYTAAGPAAAGPGQAWVYVTGDVEFLRSEVVAQEEGLNLVRNRVNYLTEVQYIPLVNGPVGAILIGAK